MKPSWYSIKNEGAQSAIIDIFDDIGTGGIRAKEFITALGALGPVSHIRLRLNSYGGEVFDGLAIYNALVRHQAKITVEIYGIAASIASVIAMAGDTVIMPANSYLFIHDPLALVVGDADDMRETAEELDKIAIGLVSAYTKKTGADNATVRKWMTSDTWFTADEALAAKLCDEVVEELAYAARADLRKLKNIPAALVPLIPPDDAPAPRSDPAPDVAAAIHELCAAYSMSAMAPILIAECQSTAEANRRLKFIEAEREEVAAKPATAAAIAKAKGRLLGILDACIGAGRPELAKQMIDTDLDVAAVKAKLADPIEFAKLEFKYDSAASREIFALCVRAGVEELAAEFIAKGTPLEEVRDRLKHADAIRCRCFAAASILGVENSKARARNFILAGLTPQEVSYALSEILVACEVEIDNKLPMDFFTGQRTPKPITDLSTTIWKNRRAQLVKLQGGRIG